MKVKILQIFLASALLLAAVQGRFIQEDELLEKMPSQFMEPRVYMPEDIEQYSEDIIKPENDLEETEEVELPVEVPVVSEVEIEPRSGGCSIPIRGGLKAKQPLYIKPGTTEFYPFSDTGRIDVAAGKNIEIHCTSGFAAPLSGKTHTATCVSGTTFKVNGVQHSLPSLVCTSWPAFVAKKSGSSCNGGTTLVNVGFELSSSRFMRQYQVCFNEHEEVTRYVYHKLFPGSNYYETGVERLNFATAGFFAGKNVDNLYTQSKQKETIDRELGYNAEKYFDNKKNIFLARGHMAAKADFMYASEQRATFLFLNTAPQWQVFNAGNWARVEDGVRAWVTKHKKTVECWTGVYGVTTLPNKNGVQTHLYLSYDANHNGLIPVPKLYFRVVIEPSTRKGIVFIGVNNPHLTLAEIKKDYIICPDISDKVSYIPWKKTDIVAGYSYACEVAEFRKKVTTLPSFSVSGLLV
ncbi:uncharacterized protein LOC119605356 [Lucilia sericata]|uniref:uncharacterized protein LOC119605356 n=1 Tax=Lucilia sericata TaxID=13632 RepID=UPI0018A85ED0|nr:uncharacterized protein LOC119605356 [Lucilia sericata]